MFVYALTAGLLALLAVVLLVDPRPVIRCVCGLRQSVMSVVAAYLSVGVAR